MSQSKYRYYEVTTTSIVRANNKTDAMERALGDRKVDALLLSENIDAVRITAADAHFLVADAV